MPIRGGATALAGICLVGTGVVTGLIASFGMASALYSDADVSGLPMPAEGILDAYFLVVVAVLAGSFGSFLVGFARPERDREEETLLDPLRYAPFHRPWKRTGVLVLVSVLPVLLAALFTLPVSHSVSLSFDLPGCGSPLGGPLATVTVPAGALFVFSWRSADGEPAAQVWAPSGPFGTGFSTSVAKFTDSSFGYSAVTGNGSALSFSGCGLKALNASAGPLQILVVGAYYAQVL